MQSKFSLMALSVMATLVIFGGDAAQAKSETTDKKTSDKTSVVVKKKEKKSPVVVTIKTGDTLAAIAESHKTSYVRLFNANDKIANPDVIYAGDKVKVPTADEQLPDRFSKLTPVVQAQVVAADTVSQVAAQPAASATTNQTSAPAPTAAASAPTYSTRGSSAGNTYGYGWCTWYAKEMRSDLPNNLGNGGSWVANAAAQGIPTGSAPRVGAIAEQPGHVAYVESVNGNMVTVSEMGYNYTQGQFNRRTVPASNFTYIY
jgi:surface antigen